MPADQLRSRDFASTRRPADEGALESAREGSGDRAWRAERGRDGRGEPRRGSSPRTMLGLRFRRVFRNRRRLGGGPAGAPFVTICHRASMADPEAHRGPRLHGPPVVVHLHRPNASAHYRGPTPDGGVPSWCVLVHRLRHKHRRPQPPGKPSWTRSCVRRRSPSFCGRRKPNWMG